MCAKVIAHLYLVAKDALRVNNWAHETVLRNQLISAKDVRIDGYSMELADLQSSETYRLGRMLTWPARKPQEIIWGR